MTRDERIVTISAALQHEFYSSIGARRRERFDVVLRRLASLALDAADATREPCQCRQCHLDRLAAGGSLDA